MFEYDIKVYNEILRKEELKHKLTIYFKTDKKLLYWTYDLKSDMMDAINESFKSLKKVDMSSCIIPCKVNTSNCLDLTVPAKEDE
jgi:hypothetical protein